MNYFLVGYFGFENKGDDWILSGVKQRILHLDKAARFFVLRPGRFRLVHFFVSLFRVQVVVFSGGSLFQNITSQRSLYFYVLIILLSRLFRRRIVCLSQGIGPINGRMSSRLVGWALRQCDYVSVRDFSSYAWAHQRGLSVVQSADTVYFNEKLVQVLEEGHGVGVSLRPTTQVSESTWDVLKQFLDHLSEKKRYFSLQSEIDRSFTTELMNAEAAALCGETVVDIMISMRYHGCVWASLKGIPFLALVYDDKVAHLAEELGQIYVDLRNDKICVDDLLSAYNRIREDRKIYQDRLKERVELCVQRVEQDEGWYG